MQAITVDASAQNRINTVFMTTMFIGADIVAAGSRLAWTIGGWPAVAAFGCGLALFAGGVYVGRRARYRIGRSGGLAVGQDALSAEPGLQNPGKKLCVTHLCLGRSDDANCSMSVGLTAARSTAVHPTGRPPCPRCRSSRTGEGLSHWLRS